MLETTDSATRPLSDHDLASGTWPGLSGMSDIIRVEAVALDGRDLPVDVHELLRRCTRLHPDEPALSYVADAAGTTVRTWSYRELLESVNATANMLSGLLRASGVVSILLPNLPETQFVLWAAQIAGIANPVNPMLGSDHIARIMAAANTEVLVCLGPTPGVDIWAKAEEARTRVPTLHTVLVVDISASLPVRQRRILRAVRRLGPVRRPLRACLPAASRVPKLANALRLLSEVLDAPATTTVDGQRVQSFDGRVGRHSGDRLTFPAAGDPARVCTMFHTGGTTGDPKLARVTARNLMFAAWAGSLNRTAGSLGPGQAMICALPLFHVNAAVVGTLVPWMLAGNVVLATPAGFRTPGLFDALPGLSRRFNATAVSGVPTVFARLVESPTAAQDSPLRFGICGGAAAPAGLVGRVREVLRLRVVEGYGLTETACIATMNPIGGTCKDGSAGLRLPYTGVRIATVSEDGLMSAPETGQSGEIVLAGPNVFDGYLDPDHDARAWARDPADGTRWFRTGDLGTIDGDGYLWITGRSKELIIRGGHNIDPAVIENALADHPAVMLAAAVGRPDRFAGELPVAYVQLVPGVGATRQELLDWAAARVGEPAAVPKDIVIVGELPLTTIGKVLKPELVRREALYALEACLKGVEGLGNVVVSRDPDRDAGYLVTLAEVAPGAAGLAREAVSELPLVVTVRVVAT